MRSQRTLQFCWDNFKESRGLPPFHVQGRIVHVSCCCNILPCFACKLIDFCFCTQVDGVVCRARPGDSEFKVLNMYLRDNTNTVRVGLFRYVYNRDID